MIWRKANPLSRLDPKAEYLQALAGLPSYLQSKPCAQWDHMESQQKGDKESTINIWADTD